MVEDHRYYCSSYVGPDNFRRFMRKLKLLQRENLSNLKALGLKMTGAMEGVTFMNQIVIHQALGSFSDWLMTCC